MIFHPDRQDLVDELLDAWRERGGNLIDTAEVYAGGQSERAIARYLESRGCRQELVILTKAFADVSEVGTRSIPDAVARGLERLGTDYIDLWLLHRDNPEVPIADIVEPLNAELEAGRIRAFGGSNWSVARLKEANEYAAARGLRGMSVSSPHVCLATAIEPFWPDCTQATAEDLAGYRETGIPVLAWSSQGRGFFLPSSGPDDANADLRRVYHNAENLAKLERARDLAAEKGVAPIEIALSYVLSLDAPIAALVGPASVAEIDSCVRAAAMRLTESETAWLEGRG